MKRKNKKKILIFGSEGEIGSKILKILSKKYIIYRIDNIEKKNLKYLKLDLTKKIKKNVFHNINFYAAIILSFYKTQPFEHNKISEKKFFEINKKILENALSLSIKKNCKKIIYFSSASVYNNKKVKNLIKESLSPNPDSIYGKFKLFAEKRIISHKKYFKNFIIFRLFNYYSDKGNVLTKLFLKKYKIFKNVKITYDGSQKRDFLHTDDIAKAIIKVLSKNESNTINLCSGNGTSINQVLKKLKIPFSNISYSKKKDYNLVGDPSLMFKKYKWKAKKKFNKFK